MCCGGAPPPPDLSPIAWASAEGAKISAEVARENLQWAKDQYTMASGDMKNMYGQYMTYLNKQLDDQKAATDRAQTQADHTIYDQRRLVEDALARAKINDENAKEDREFYETKYRPLEEAQIAEINKVASDEYKTSQRGRSMSGVAQAFDQQRQGALQSLEGFGVDPSSTRYAALDIGLRASKAAAMAAAGTQSDLTTDAIARAMRSDSINVGRGYPGSVAQTYGTSIASGGLGSQASSAASGAANGAAAVANASGAAGAGMYGGALGILNAGVGAGATYGNLMGSGPAWANAGNQAIQTWGNTVNQGYQNQLAHHASSGGLGSLLGAGLGAASMFGYEEGGMVQEQPGAAVPMEASPSRGAIPDDVPARLQPDEFVVPADVLKWKGEEFFQKTIQQARQSKGNGQQRPARPQMRAPLPGPPAFVSPGARRAAAIPMGA